MSLATTQLCDTIIAAKDVVEVILSNSGKDDQTKAWDAATRHSGSACAMPASW